MVYKHNPPILAKIGEVRPCIVQGCRYYVMFTDIGWLHVNVPVEDNTSSEHTTKPRAF